jgi:hypothetical protein
MIRVGLQGIRLSRVTGLRMFPHNVCPLNLMSTRINCNQEGTTTMANGWIRCTSFPCPLSVVDTTNDRICSAAVVNEYYRRIHTEASTWLAQANYIFNCLEIPRGFENFGIFPVSRSRIVMMISPVSIHAIDYDLKLFGPTDKLPSGYLFLCPLANLQPEDRTCFRIPDCAAYWSLDPSGFNRLSWEVAEDLGFPAIHVEMYARVQSWDASVYNRIRQFQKAKGFDPYSQEVARALGCPPLRVSCDWKTLLTHSKPRMSIIPMFLTLTQYTKIIQLIAPRIQTDYLTQKKALNLEMGNMVCFALPNYEFYRAHRSSCRFDQLRAQGWFPSPGPGY